MHSPKSIIERNDQEALKQFYVAGADINANIQMKHRIVED